MASKKIRVEILGDSKSLEQAFGRASQATRSYGSSLGHVAKVSALAVGAAGLGGLAVVLKQGISEWAKSAKVSAQTAAAVKSTAGAANVTAKQVDALAASLLRKSGIDDEAIKSGENLLLTFTNIRNEAGKGNDIFSQATQTMTDMSVALGQDMKSSAIQLGKALNDPIKGITALQRVGVSFSESQREQIKTLIEHGKTLDAQKLILGELNKEFGGSAEAMGKTLPGQISILKESFNNLAGNIVGSLVPSFQKAVTWTTANWPTIERVFHTVFSAIGVVLREVVSIIGWVVSTVRGHWSQISATSEQAWGRVQASAERVAAWYRGTLQPTITSVVHTLGAIWDRFGGDITRIASTAFNTVAAVIRNALNIIKATIEIVLALVRGDWGKAWDSLKTIVSNSLQGIFTLMKGAASIALKAAAAIGRAIIDGVLSGVGGLFGALKSKLEGTLKSVLSSLNPFSPVEHGGELYIGQPLAEGAIRGWVTGAAELPAKMTDSIRKAVDKARQAVDNSRSRLGNAFSRLSSDALSGFDAIAGKKTTPAERALAALTSQHDAAARQRDLAEARAALDEARKGDDPQAIVDAQRRVDDLLYEEERASLEKRAAEERVQLDARTEIRRRHFEDGLNALGISLEQEGATVGDAHKRVMGLLGSFGVNFKSIGAAMGAAWVAGLKESIAGASEGAGELSGTISKTAGAIPAVTAKAASSAAHKATATASKATAKVKHRALDGPVSAGMPYIVGEHGQELFVPNANGRIVSNHGLRRGTQTVEHHYHYEVNVSGVLDPELNERSLMRAIRNIERLGPGSAPIYG